MKKNRKTTRRMSVMAATTMRFGVILMVFFIMVIVNILSSNNCAHLLKQKGQLERELARLNDARERELATWASMKTPQKIEEALLRHGLKMPLPRHDQNVFMNRDGRPRAGQLSVAKAAQRVPAVKSAKYVSRSGKAKGRTIR